LTIKETAAQYERVRAVSAGQDLVYSCSIRHNDATSSPAHLTDLIGQYGRPPPHGSTCNYWT